MSAVAAKNDYLDISRRIRAIFDDLNDSNGLRKFARRTTFFVELGYHRRFPTNLDAHASELCWLFAEFCDMFLEEGAEEAL
jgi:hypothetical protein